MIKKILVANRGEIALRVFRTCRQMGIGTVAVYSSADENSLHTLHADEAIFIGDPEPSKSYLVIEKIIQAAKDSGADAIHPGYGFLSERAEFSDACRDAGITFLGPSGAAMRMLGSKIDAKIVAEANQVPVTPGMFKPGATQSELKEAADAMGYPVMLKASAGGGGRGMRIVNQREDFDNQFEIASNEALSGFGDSAMMVEKLVIKPRHIEVQLIADSHGNVAPLFERECSIQRRHQKLIEEVPSPHFVEHPEMWESMRDAAVRLVKAANYVGAGTCEFIVDGITGDFYFLEINARLQVEHPVTEEVTGLDLVRLQIEVANGASLKDLIPDYLDGDRKNLQGHSIEARIVAENPAKNFMPSVGKITAWELPNLPGVRIDSGFDSTSTVSPFYDSLIAKVIVKAQTREMAIDRLITALREFHVLGVRTNIGYQIDLLNHPEFRSGHIDTGFIAREFDGWNDESLPLPEELGVILNVGSKGIGLSGVEASKTGASPENRQPAWAIKDGWRVHK